MKVVPQHHSLYEPVAQLKGNPLDCWNWPEDVLMNKRVSRGFFVPSHKLEDKAYKSRSPPYRARALRRPTRALRAVFLGDQAGPVLGRGPAPPLPLDPDTTWVGGFFRGGEGTWVLNFLPLESLLVETPPDKPLAAPRPPAPVPNHICSSLSAGPCGCPRAAEDKAGSVGWTRGSFRNVFSASLCNPIPHRGQRLRFDSGTLVISGLLLLAPSCM